MSIRPLTLGLLAVLALTQTGLWLGEGGLPQVARLRGQLTAQQARNDEVRRGNERLSAEVLDLRQGLEMVEERARSDLGLIRRDELFVQYNGRPLAAADAALSGQPAGR